MPRLALKRSKADRAVVGLEIEPRHIAAAEVAVNGHVSLTRGAVEMLRPGIMRDGEVTDEAELASVLRTFFDTHGLPRHVRLGIANQRIVVRSLDLPVLEDPKQLAQAVRMQAPDHIPMPIDEAVMDFQPLGVVETPAGPRSRVTVVAVRRDMVERLVGAAQLAGLKLAGIDLSAFAMIRSLDVEMPAGEAVLYVNVGGITNVAVASGASCLFTRTAHGGVRTSRRRSPSAARSPWSTPASGSPTSGSSARWRRSRGRRPSSSPPAPCSPRASTSSPTWSATR